MKVLILIADGFEDLELYVPWCRLQEEGVSVRLAAPQRRACVGRRGYSVPVDAAIMGVIPSEFDLLLIPGGDAPEILRLREEAVDIARTFAEEGRTIAALSHGPQLLISAGVLEGKEATCAPGIRDDVKLAGARYRDESVVVDGPLLTCRGPEDLPQFCRQLMLMLRVRAG